MAMNKDKQNKKWFEGGREKANRGHEEIVNITGKIYDVSGTIIGGWLHPSNHVG